MSGPEAGVETMTDRADPASTSGGSPMRPPGYDLSPGVPDEMVAPDGSLRPLWQPIMRALAQASPAEIEALRGRADQYLRDSGVFYRQYAGATSDERLWPLSPVPVLMDEGEWDDLAPGLIQRADLLEAVMADFYGPNRLIADGHLPPALVADNPEWLRPMVGIRPRDGHFLHFLAFEIGRGPDGGWWVLADRAQAPSGAGYALENRVATARAFSDLYAASNVHRLAGFFREFRDGLQGLVHQAGGAGAEGRALILSPGPMNETYYEHAYIARYLGLTLAQGEDLTVSNGKLFIRTVSGPSPVDVLWRRLDSNYADPVELNPASQIGTPGMVSALRAGGLSMVNSLGSGVLESRALMAFLPRLAPHLLGMPLRVPNIATWWLGAESERQALTASPGDRVLLPALSTSMPFDPDETPVFAASLSPYELRRRLSAEGHNLVAQEVVRLSTTPMLNEQNRLVPRPMTMRVFLARINGHWQVMRGGFARIGASTDPSAIAMQRGGSSADVWIMGRAPIDPATMIAPTTNAERRAAWGALPARTADNLFWLGRYIERSEAAIRLLRACNTRRAETGTAAESFIDALEPLAEIQGIETDGGIPPGLISILAAAGATAARVRDRFSPDAWSALTDLEKTARRMAGVVTPGDDSARALSALLRKLAGISGLVHENMYRSTGWRFLSIGRLHERAMSISAALAVLADPSMPDGALDLAVEIGDSVLTHRRRFTLATSRNSVIDLLGLDDANPRALAHQIDGLRDGIGHLPGVNPDGHPSELLRAILRLQVDVQTAQPEELTTEALWELRGRIAALSNLLTEEFFR